MTIEHRTATAGAHPCEVYLYHAPQPTRTQFHHSKPVYLQNELYDRIVFGPDLWVCGTCHDSIHDWISWLLGAARKPVPEPGYKIKRIAQAAVDWYLSEKEKAHGRQAEQGHQEGPSSQGEQAEADSPSPVRSS